MDTGPASCSETFRISGERGRVYVGTFRIPYSRGLSLSLSFSVCPFLVLLLFLLLLLFVPFPLLVACIRLERKKRDLRCAIVSVQQAMPVLLLSLLLLLSAGCLAAWLMVPMLLIAPPHAVKYGEPEPKTERGGSGREEKERKKEKEKK